MSSIISRIKRHISDRESYHHRIARDFVIVGLFVFIGKLIGAAKEIAIAWRYGTSNTVDAYVFITNFINWPISIWFSVLSVVLVPILIKNSDKDEINIQRFNSEVLGVTIIFSLVIFALFYLFFDQVIAMSFQNVPGNNVRDVVKMASQLSIMLPFGFLAGLLSVWIMASGRQSNSVIDAVPAAVLLVVLLLPNEFIAKPLIFGSVCGVLFQLATLCLCVLGKSKNLILIPAFSFQSSIWNSVLKGLIIITLGQLFIGSSNVVDQYFAARLGTGQIAILGYTNRVTSLMLTMGAIAISRATLPVFSSIEFATVELNKLACKWALWMFLLGLIAISIVWLYAPFIIKVIYQRGAFNADDTNVVVHFFRLSLLQVPLFMAGMVFVSALSSSGKVWWITTVSIIVMVVKCVTVWSLIDYLELSAIIASAAVMQFFSVLLCWFATNFIR